MPPARPWARAAHRLVLLAAAGLVALAPQGGAAQTVDQQLAMLPYIPLRDNLTRYQQATPVEVPDDARAVRTALIRAMKDFKIPVENEKDENAVLLGTTRMVKSRELNKEPLSSYLSCGNGVQGPNADLFRLTFAFLAAIEPVAKGTKVTFFMAGEGRSPEGVSTQPVVCWTRGVLEKRVADRMKFYLLGG